jgi:hypothetical protein
MVITEFGVGNKREPMLGDAFVSDQGFGFYANKDLCKEFVVVGYGFSW